jgi:hypothetical protein
LRYDHVCPPSSVRYTPPESCSICAHTRLGFAGETASPIFPTIPVGSPRAVRIRFAHVAPPSVDL